MRRERNNPLETKMGSQVPSNRAGEAPAAATGVPVATEILRALLDTIRTLSDYWRAVLLMGFTLLIIALCSIRSHSDLAWGAILGMVLIFMTALLRKSPGNTSLADGQDERARMILPRPVGTNPRKYWRSRVVREESANRRSPLTLRANLAFVVCEL
jgi:hypothetical protein